MKFQSAGTYDYRRFPGEINNEPSMTVPDQTMSLKELLERYARGLPVAGAKQEIFHGEEFVPDLNRMDLSEQQDLREHLATEIPRLQADLKRQDEDKAKAKKEAEESASKSLYERFKKWQDEEGKGKKVETA